MHQEWYWSVRLSNGHRASDVKRWHKTLLAVVATLVALWVGFIIAANAGFYFVLPS